MTTATTTSPTPSDPSPTTTPTQQSTIPISLSLAGGLDLLFNNTRDHAIALPVPSARAPTVSDLIAHLSQTFHARLPKARRDLFSWDATAEEGEGGERKGVTVRPGILVLVNDVDWELEEERETVLESGDEVVFVSTLHGG